DIEHEGGPAQRVRCHGGGHGHGHEGTRPPHGRAHDAGARHRPGNGPLVRHGHPPPTAPTRVLGTKRCITSTFAAHEPPESSAVDYGGRRPRASSARKG